MEIKINPRFKEALPPLTPDQFTGLEEQIVQEGCRDPLVLWDETLVDGHNRLVICQKNNIPFKTESMVFSSEDAAVSWIYKTQLNRRNLKPEETKYYRGKHYEAEKASHGGDRKSSVQNAHLNGKPSGQNTSEKLGALYGVDESTIRRDGKYAEALDAIGVHSETAKQKILSGEVTIGRQALKDLMQWPDAIESLAKKIDDGTYVKPTSPVNLPTKPPKTILPAAIKEDLDIPDEKWNQMNAELAEKYEVIDEAHDLVIFFMRELHKAETAMDSVLVNLKPIKGALDHDENNWIGIKTRLKQFENIFSTIKNYLLEGD